MQFIPDLFSLLQPFAEQMAAPTFSNLLTILTGWILSRRHTISAGLAAGGPLARHFSSFYRVFSKSGWDVDAVGLGIARVVLAMSALIPCVRTRLVVDDTLCKKKGRLPFGVGMHYDASATGRGLSNSHGCYKANGHCRVIMGLGVELSFRPGHIYCLPILARLYHNHKSSERHDVEYQTKVQLAVQMIKLTTDKFAGRQFDLLVDSAYAGKNMLAALPDNCHLTARWIRNPALYDQPPTSATGRRGRPRVHGKRLPGVAQIIKKPARRIEVDVYGKHKTLDVWQTFVCFYDTPKRLLNLVVTRALDADAKPDDDSPAVLFSTNTTLSPQQVVELYAGRWAIEVTIHDAKQQLGIAQPQVWCAKSVKRAVPTMLMMYSSTVAWFAGGGGRTWRPTIHPWYRGKTDPSFGDMLGHLRIRLLDEQMDGILKDRSQTPEAKKALARFAALVKQAA